MEIEKKKFASELDQSHDSHSLNGDPPGVKGLRRKQNALKLEITRLFF